MTKIERKCSCKADIHLNDKIVSCFFCKQDHHIECKGVNYKEYIRLIKEKGKWFCDIKCKDYQDSEQSSSDGIPENPTNMDIFIMLKDVRASQKHMSEGNDELIENVKQLTAEFKKLKDENEILKARILSLETKRSSSASSFGENSDQEKLVANVVISGIPNMTADLSDTVIKIASTSDESLEILPQQILSIERLFVQSENTPESKIIANIPVVVKFDDRATKLLFIKALKLKKNLVAEEIGLVGSQKIFASDHMTSANFKIISKARALRRSGVIKHAWIQNSSILIKENEDSKIVAIRNIYELNKYDKVDLSSGSSVG